MLKRRIFEQEHDMFRDTVRKWAAAELAPRVDEFQQSGMVSKEVWKSAGEAGFLALIAGEKHGGLELEDFRFDQVLAEEISAVDAGFFAPLHNRIVTPYLKHFGTPDQQDRYMPGVVSGDVILAIAMTEPGAGSDLAGIKTNAVDKGDYWELNGQKTYISNGQLADLVVVAAKTDPASPHAIGLFLVEPGFEGFTRGKSLKKLGLHSQDTSELFFDGVKVPKENVLGDPKGGFKMMMKNLAEERLIGGVGYTASAERAFDITMDYITERRAFGQSVGTFQNSRFKMAEMRTKLDVSWAYVDHCVLEHNENALSSESAAQLKLFTSEMQGEVVDECLQLHGGAGYMQEYEISRLYADARISRIYAGSSEIMKEIIGRGLGLDDRKRN